MPDDLDNLVTALSAGRQIDLPVFLRTAEGADEFGAELATMFERLKIAKPLFVSGTSQSAAVCTDLIADSATRTQATDNTREEVVRVAKLAEGSADAIVAVGGGRPIDVAKSAAFVLDLPVVVVPTQLSADGIASPISVIRETDGQAVSERSQLPVAVIADLNVVASAPIEFARAGVGDLISNRTAIKDWRIAEAAGEDTVDDFAALLATCAHLLIEGMDLSPLGNGELTIDLARRLLDGLVLSGLAMEIAGSSRPCSGSEHLISHALDQLEPGTASHGEQVAFGTLLAMEMQGDDSEPTMKLLASAGLNGALTGFGLTTDRLAEIVKFGPSTRPGRYTVLDRDRPSAQEIRALVDGLRN